MNQKKTMIKIGVGVVLAVALLSFAYVKLGGVTYSEGERTGVVTKFSRKGMMVKTWEGELNMGGFDQGGVAQSWQFSVVNPEMIEKVQEAQRAGGRWTLGYRQQLWTQSWKGSTGYFIISVDPAGNSPSNR